MLNLHKIVLAASLLSLLSSSYATICEQAPGGWIGNWQDQRHHQEATLKIKINNPSYFIGKYSLADKSSGTLRGKCKQLTVNEAYLTLKQDPPWYNPCRGTIIRTNSKLAIHFFCFNPNQSGYFTKI